MLYSTKLDFLGLCFWCLTQLSTLFQLYRGGQFIGGGNRRNHRPVADHWHTLSLNVVSSAPRHERGSNSQH